MKLSVIGAGYVGLVTAACLADVGHQVCVIDIDKTKVQALQQGRIPIFEPGLAPIVQRNIEKNRLHFTCDMMAAISFASTLFIAVGTPPEEDGSADLQHVLAVANAIATHMDSHKIVVTKSTVPVGTADQVRSVFREKLLERKVAFSVDVVANPEFLKEGAAVADFMRPDRIIVGTDSEACRSLMREIYAPFNRQHDRMMFMDTRSAELTKYAANAMLATKISFMNEMANLAEQLGADIEQVRQGIGADPRIGYHFIYPGCGFGGSCFPKDLNALVNIANKVGYRTDILQSVIHVNQRQKLRLFDKIQAYFSNNLEGKTFAVWGLSFKPKTDDMREAPSISLMSAIWASGGRVQAYDPEAMGAARDLFGHRNDFSLVGSPEEALQGADALVVCTEWHVFRAPDFELIEKQLSYPVIFDGRNLYDPDRVKYYGLQYYGIGRGN
ncbi:UDP-glucose dehydrogenase family protein [Zooshikella ganghwensis]|uniref:UDP-glucose 6-dehydrogenase n=1 Tax=Zooshikella ganghwensis TaxID=202772 RepID=A0A4P9VMS4_9GAMM|nr:UDP-glucose/GDP-mannose dehydrogenase family protein [Zooshikella ganghwensis]RDH44663.1 UDP-glucose/GDP-mannose dehydrogenase family protein [Zooshikella ganghwensis]